MTGVVRSSGGERRSDAAAAGAILGLPASYSRWRQSRLGKITDAIEAELLFDLLGPISGLRVLDVGCGDGALAVELARRGAGVTGLDPNPEMLSAARRRADAQALRLHLVAGRAEELPFADAAFDRVLAVAVLCIIEDPSDAIAEMARVLRPGGKLIIGELGRWSIWAAERRVRGLLGAPTWQAARFRTARELRSRVAAAGLEILETRGAVFYPPFASLARLLLPWDLWLGRRTTFGAAFLALSGTKADHGKRAARPGGPASLR